MDVSFVLVSGTYLYVCYILIESFKKLTLCLAN